MQSTGIFFSGWMEFNASRILKIEKKRNGGRKSRWQVEGGFLDIWKEGGARGSWVNWQSQSSQSGVSLKEAVPLVPIQLACRMTKVGASPERLVLFDCQNQRFSSTSTLPTFSFYSASQPCHPKAHYYSDRSVMYSSTH